MSEKLPQWAIDRALSYVAHGQPLDGALLAFARYIAAREEPPVCPLAEEAQELADQLSINLSAMPWVEGVLLTALRRGMELALENGNV